MPKCLGCRLHSLKIRAESQFYLNAPKFYTHIRKDTQKRANLKEATAGGRCSQTQPLREGDATAGQCLGRCLRTLRYSRVPLQKINFNSDKCCRACRRCRHSQRLVVCGIQQIVKDLIVRVNLNCKPGIPLQLATGSLADGPPESLTAALKGTSLLRHTHSLRTKLLEAVGPELQRADDRQHLWELSVWAQSVIMSRAFKIPKGSDRLVLIPIVDIANHAATHRLANADVRNNADGSVSMVAVRDIAKGEEVRICYGEYTNEQLLFCYGFVIPDNPCQGPPGC